MGERGFGDIVDDLTEFTNLTDSRAFVPAQFCDISAQTITVTLDRSLDNQIKFSRSTFRGALSIMTYAPVTRRGIWAFLRPLEWKIWVGLALTVPIVPIFVVLFELIFSGRCASRFAAGAALIVPIFVVSCGCSD